MPAEGGTTPNPTGERALLVPASYRWPTSAGLTDPTVDGLPPAESDPTCAKVAGSAPSTAHPGTCTVALDADLTLPTTPPPAGGYPLVVMMHGCCAGSKVDWESSQLGAGGEKWHYNSAWFATRGYVVLTYTARGFVNGNNQGSTGQTQIDSLQYEMNDMQSLTAQLADDPSLQINPQKLVITGGSYGGGFSWLALVDPTWQSPGGHAMKLAAVAPRYGWTDLVDSLVPTGRQFYDLGPLPATDGSDSGLQPPGSKTPELVGIPKRSIVAALYASGKTGIPPGSSHATFPPSIDQAFQCTQTFYPAEQNPACAQTISTVLPDFIKYRSAYYWNAFFNRIKSDPAARIPVFSAGTLTDPLFPPIEHRRMVDRLQATVPGYPVQEYYGDYEHFTQNKDKEWGDICGSDHHVCRVSDYPGGDLTADPTNLVRTGATTYLNRFIDHYAQPSGDSNAPEPSFNATASTQVCENMPLGQRPDEPGATFTAKTFAALAPGRLRIDFAGSQTTTNKATPNSHAVDADPVYNQVHNSKQCVIETSPAGAGVAVYDSAALPAQATMIGGSVVMANYSATDTVGLELNARLYDVLPDGSAILVDRGPRRIDPSRDGTSKVSFQLHGNGWRFRRGDRVRLELAQDDSPYLHESDVPSSMTISHVHLEIPIHEPTSSTPSSSRPTVKLLAPRLASDVSRSPRFRVHWRASDIGSTISGYSLEARTVHGRSKSAWRTIGHYGASTTSAIINGHYDTTYLLRLRATDRAGKRSPYGKATTIVPTRVRPSHGSYHGPWQVVLSRGAFGGRLLSCSSNRCTLAWRFFGSGVYLIGELGPNSGQLRAWLDKGSSHLVDLYRPRAKQRAVLLRLRGRASWHTLHIQVLARKRRQSHGFGVSLNGFGVQP